MSAVDSLQPDWMRELLGIWMSGDVEGVRRELGLPSVSPMFKRLGDADEEEGSYSSAEVAATKAAVDRLQAEHPEEWRELRLAFRPWTTRGQEIVIDQGLLQSAVTRLAAWVDEMVDG